MTRDKKIALFVAPFLVVGGFIAADYYARYRTAEEAKEKKLFPLSLHSSCDISHNPCVLIHQPLQLELADNAGVTRLTSTHPLDSVTFSYLEPSGQEHSYQFSPYGDQQQWKKDTDLSNIAGQSPSLTLRLIVTIKSAYYFAEFTTIRTEP